MGGWGTEKQDAEDNWERLKEHAEAQREGKQHGQSASVKELARLLLGLSPSLTFSVWMDVWHSAA